MDLLHICINKNGGFSLVELILAFSILSIVLVGGLNLWFFNEMSLKVADKRQLLLSQGLSFIQSLETVSSTSFSTIQSGTTTIDDTIYSMSVANPDQFTKEVVLSVSSALSAKVVLKKTLFDLARRNEQSSCVTHLTADWSSPIVKEVLSPFTASSTATSIKIQKNIAYVSVNSPIRSDPDLYVFDISDPQHIALLSSLDTGPGITSIALSWPYIYAANTSINAQLQIIDISNPLTPLLKINFKLPGVYKDVGYVGNSIALYKNTLVLGTRKSDGPEIHVINVINPLAPVETGSYEMNTSINKVSLTNTMLYVASPLDEELSVLDISDPTQVKHVGGFNASGMSGSGMSLYQLGPTLYLGRTLGNDELSILDVSSSSPQLETQAVLKTSIKDLLVRDQLIFMATIDTTKQFQIWTNHTMSLSPLSSIQLSGHGVGLDCSGTTMFVVTDSSPSFYSITSS